jgi:hypothetical protein
VSLFDSNLGGKRQNDNMSVLWAKWGAKPVNGTVGDAFYCPLPRALEIGRSPGRQGQYGDFIHILSTFFQYCFCRPDFLSVLAGSAFLYPLSEDMDDFSI